MGLWTVFSRALLLLILWISKWANLRRICSNRSSFIFFILMKIRTLFLIVSIIVRAHDGLILGQIQKHHHICWSIWIFLLIRLYYLLIVIIIDIIVTLVLNVLLKIILILLLRHISIVRHVLRLLLLILVRIELVIIITILILLVLIVLVLLIKWH